MRIDRHKTGCHWRSASQTPSPSVAPHYGLLQPVDEESEIKIKYRWVALLAWACVLGGLVGGFVVYPFHDVYLALVLRIREINMPLDTAL